MKKFPIIFPGYKMATSIYGGSRTLVYRAVHVSKNQPVIIKIPRNPHPLFNELVKFRNQYIITRHLDSPYIVKPLTLERHEHRYALIMPDDGAVSLSQYWQSSNQNLHTFLTIAIQLADALHYLNQQHIIHKDIKPANILIQSDTHHVQLIDFSLASSLPKEQQHLTNPNSLEGTLAYISPEQTGRMNRGIDYRTDFYSLGVTFFELLTGTLPYSANDPMELVHCHIAQGITFPEESPLFEIPNVLQAMVLKLMAKNAEDRYQSALGLKYDLEQCRQQLETAGHITTIELGERDICDRFLIPEKLYGRENEIKTLLDAFKRVTGKWEKRGVESIGGKEKSRSELLLVTGFSGIGKTAVVNEIHKPITPQHGYFIKGKYDQFNRNIPFFAFVQAFRSLMGQLLGESDAELRNWKTKILDAVGESGQVIIDVIPELEHIIGAQPAVPELSGSAAQNRFNLLFGQFVQVFTTQDHPLVIFLDDLQWVDSASLKLLKLLMNESEAGYLLLLGAYRDNEVYPAHPLMLTLDELQKQGATLNTLTLNPLDEKDITHLVADTLLCSTEIAIPLSQLVYQKTQGNPFFTLQFLQGLYDDGWIEFERERGYWQSDLTKVRQLSLTDDVVEFMVERLRKLPEATQEILKLAACIGNQFSLGTLAIVCEDSQEDVAINLWQALQEGFVVPESEIYKFFQGDEAEDRGFDNIIVHYHFLHDRVQQAAYALIDEDRQKASHLRIGKLLHSKTPKLAIEEKIFEIVNHLNIARELIISQSERDELAQLNWISGKKAKQSTAYATAKNYLSIGLELQDDHCWQQDYDFTLKLHLEATEVAYLSGNFLQMEQLADEVLERVEIPLEAWKIYEVRILAYEAQGRALEAVEMTLPFLKTLGVEFPKNPSQSDILQALKNVNLCLEDKTIENLVELPLMQDPRQLVVIHLLMNLGTASYFAVPQLTPLLMAKAVCLSIEYGNSADSSFAYSAYAFILCGVVGDIETGYKFGQLAVNLLSQFDNKSIEVKTLETVNVLVLHWRSHLRNALQPLLQAYQVGLDVGELNFAGLSVMNYGFYSYFLGTELSQLAKELINYSQVMKKLKQTNCLSQTDIFRQAVINLSGEVENPCDLAGDVYDEHQKIPQHENDNEINILGIFHLNKLILHYLFDQSNLAVEQGNQVKPYLGTMMGRFLVPIFHFYQVLALLANAQTLSHEDSEQWWADINEHQQEMEKWAQYAPMNFLHKFHLITAEKQRVLGKQSAALDFYDRAIVGAKENGYIQEEALANELAAKFYLDWSKEKVAAGYMQDAYYCYTQWGAKAKTDRLENRYPHLLQPILGQPSFTVNPIEILKKISNPDVSTDSTIKSHASSLHINNSLDFASILKASQSLSKTIQLNELLCQLTQIILQYSGGDRCALILLDEHGSCQVRMLATSEQTNLISQPLEQVSELPVHLIQYTKHTQETAIQNQIGDELPVEDTWLNQHSPQSFLCMPLLNQGTTIGILYISNQRTQGVFRSDRLHILSVLANQATISLKNAQLYDLEQIRSQQLAETNQKLALTQFSMDNAVTGMTLLNFSSEFCYTNQAMSQMLGYSLEELTQLTIADIDLDWTLARFQDTFIKLKLSSGDVQDDSTIFESRHRHKNGTIYPVEITAKHICFEDEDYLFVQIKDISDRKQAQAQLLHNALHDALTDLPNRSLLMQQLDRAINQAKQVPNYHFAVLFLDFDNFKVINDSLGHQTGDRLLIAIAQRLTSIVKATDLAVRLGGDEFVLLLDNVGSLHEVVKVTERIFTTLGMPIPIEGREVFISASIGIVLGTEHYNQATDLLRDADLAMYQAKDRGKGQYAIFDAQMHTQALRRMQLEHDLRRAMEQGEFKVYYQPVISLEQNQIVGLEALVRWQPSSNRLISPDQFIPIAEETGLIVSIDRWVLQVACQQLADWYRQFPQYQHLTININLSGRDLQQPTALMATIEHILASNHLKGQSLALEITESMLIANKDQTIELLTKLRQLGVKVCIDDFGTGYSSLSYLCNLPVTTLKVDKSFVSQMQTSRKNYKIVEAVIALSQQLNLETVAEGIETPQQLTWIKEMGVSYGQGYLFSRPLDTEAMTLLLFEGRF